MRTSMPVYHNAACGLSEVGDATHHMVPVQPSLQELVAVQSQASPANFRNCVWHLKPAPDHAVQCCQQTTWGRG